MTKFVDADPYKWPYNGDLTPSNTAIIVIDMQVDFCAKGGYVDTSEFFAITRFSHLRSLAGFGLGLNVFCCHDSPSQNYFYYLRLSSGL